MIIKSTVAEATKYGDDALEAFYTAVDNGQARLALIILVDVIKAFEEKIDELTAAKTEVASVSASVEKIEEPKQTAQTNKQKTVEKTESE